MAMRSHDYLDTHAEMIEKSKLPSEKHVLGHFMHRTTYCKRIPGLQRPTPYSKSNISSSALNLQPNLPTLDQRARATIPRMEAVEEQESLVPNANSHRCYAFKHDQGTVLLIKLIEHQ